MALGAGCGLALLLGAILGAMWMWPSQDAPPAGASALAGEVVLQQVAALQAQARRMLAHPDAAAVAEFNALPPQLQALLAQTARAAEQLQTRAACQGLMPVVDAFERRTRDALAAVRAAEALARNQRGHGEGPAS